MKTQWALSLLAAYGSLASASHAAADRLIHHLHGHHARDTTRYKAFEKRNTSTAAEPRFLNNVTSKFAVNGTAIPEVDFDVGESYSGLLPISNKTDERDHLFFWFFPTANEEHKAKKEITIWLNGGPGCSSLLGLLQENGPFQWYPGTRKPQRNPWSWHLLTNVVWIEQPVGVGFSQGNVSATNEDELSQQFLGFWKNFVDAFSMQGYKVYIAAESYGGFYGPYISSHMIGANDTDYYDLGGLIVYDGLMFDRMIQANVPVLDYVGQHSDEFALDDTVKAHIHNVSEHCGFNAWNDKYLRYPPSGPAPKIPPGFNVSPNGTLIADEECQELWDYVTAEALKANPCFNVYNILDHCPIADDPLDDEAPYFNRPDVKKAIHAPDSIQWTRCVERAFNTSTGSDPSPPPDSHQLPLVIDTTNNVILAHGAMDWVLTLHGVLLGVQNMTWGGKLGFQTAPSDPFYVPLYGYDPFEDGGYYAARLPAGSGVQGTVHHERGLTLVVTQLAGHEGPLYAAAAAFRHLEKLLGRVHSMSDTEPFTLPELRNITQLKKPLGKGIVKIPA